MSEKIAGEQDYMAIAHSALSGPTPNYNLYHAAIAATHMDVPGRSGLVVGCNQGFVSDDQIEYWLDPSNINQRRARDYVNACASIESLALIRNEIDFENPGSVDRAAVRECVALGYDAFDLFGLTHTLMARKI